MTITIFNKCMQKTALHKIRTVSWNYNIHATNYEKPENIEK